MKAKHELSAFNECSKHGRRYGCAPGCRFQLAAGEALVNAQATGGHAFVVVIDPDEPAHYAIAAIGSLAVVEAMKVAMDDEDRKALS